MFLLEDQATDTTSGDLLNCKGGTYVLQAAGTFDGATITLVGSLGGLPFTTLTDFNGTDVTITEAGWRYVVAAKHGLRIRADVSDAGGSTSVSLVAVV